MDVLDSGSASDSASATSAPVLIAGGGLVGLSTAMFLAQYGVRSVAIERLRGGSQLPRAAHFHMRTLELFRLAGIEEQVKAQSEREFLPEGSIVMMESLAGRKLADIIASLNEGVEEVSPCRRLFVTQPGLEPILRARAEEAGASVLDGHEVVAVDQNDDGVTVTARDVDSGVDTMLHGSYLVGADGAHSAVRDLLDIPFEGRGVFSNSVTIYFTADLRPQMEGKPISVIYINNPTFGGFFRLDKSCESGFLVINTLGDPTSADAANAAADTSEPRMIQLVRIGAGVPDLPVRIDGLARWRATADVARHYRVGRIFLAGDAAHLMPPNGGFGGNTGIHDAHNLAWKLALVLNGQAQPALLDTYEAERRPVGRFTVEQAYTRYVTRTAPHLGAENAEPLAPDFDIELGYLYRSPAVMADGVADASTEGDGVVHHDPRETHASPGSRLPHVWVSMEPNGSPVSTIDLADSTFSVLTPADGGAWCDAAKAVAADHPGLELRAHRIDDPDADLPTRFGISGSGAVLVRPDGFVAWRTERLPDDPVSALGGALTQVLNAEEMS
jgi:2-polyprenyl-6-methoxyphenol hydroxylase-like FAD-dependent oxidoreductase